MFCFVLGFFYDAHIKRETSLDDSSFINNLWRLSEVGFLNFIFVLYSDLATCPEWLPAERVEVMSTIMEASLQRKEKQNIRKEIS